MDPHWLHDRWVIDHWLPSMAKTLTLKNLPDALHARLAAAAKRHRRSLNNEAIVCLEAGLGAASPSVEQQLAEIRALPVSPAPTALIPPRSTPPSVRVGLDRR
jgi:plasmid stability protein